MDFYHGPGIPLAFFFEVGSPPSVFFGVEETALVGEREIFLMLSWMDCGLF